MSSTDLDASDAHAKKPRPAPGLCWKEPASAIGGLEFVLHRNPEQVTGVVEAADQMVACLADVVYVAVIHKQMGVADVELHVRRGRVAGADRDPAARAIRDTWIAREITGRGLVEGKAAAQGPLVVELVVHAYRAEPGIAPLVGDIDRRLRWIGEGDRELIERTPASPAEFRAPRNRPRRLVPVAQARGGRGRELTAGRSVLEQRQLRLREHELHALRHREIRLSVDVVVDLGLVIEREGVLRRRLPLCADLPAPLPVVAAHAQRAVRRLWQETRHAHAGQHRAEVDRVGKIDGGLLRDYRKT